MSDIKMSTKSIENLDEILALYRKANGDAWIASYLAGWLAEYVIDTGAHSAVFRASAVPFRVTVETTV